MINLIKRLIAFLLPIIGKAALQTAADVITDAAYPERRPRQYNRLATPYTRYDRRPRRYSEMVDYAKKDVQETEELFAEHNLVDDDQDTDPGFHDVLMVAFDLKGRSAEQVHEWLHAQMPTTGDYPRDINLDAWWVANDERFDGSDCDSAVFVPMGDQVAARGLLRRAGFGLGR